MFDDTLIATARDIAERLIARKETVAVSESSSGGLLSAVLLAVPGASAYYLGGAVVYTRQARRGLLQVADEWLTGIRSSSEPYAGLKARTIRTRLGSTWGLAETGAAGPSGNRYGDKSGHSCLAVDGPVVKVITLETGSDSRIGNMRAFAQAGLELFRDALKAAG